MAAEKRYVHEGVEVVLTGRKAQRKLRTKIDEQVEIKPANPEDGSFRKWVRMDVLYEITEE